MSERSVAHVDVMDFSSLAQMTCSQARLQLDLEEITVPFLRQPASRSEPMIRSVQNNEDGADARMNVCSGSRDSGSLKNVTRTNMERRLKAQKPEPMNTIHDNKMVCCLSVQGHHTNRNGQRDDKAHDPCCKSERIGRFILPV